MRHCHENDSRIADQAPGGGYGQKDVPASWKLLLLECIYVQWSTTLPYMYADPIMHKICFLGSLRPAVSKLIAFH